jgi:predicted secreted protein
MKSVSNNKPEAIQKIGPHNYRFNYDIFAVPVTDQQSSDETEQTTHIQYEYQTVDVYDPISSNSITQAVIADKWPSDYEQKIINEYNGAQLGVYSESVSNAKIAAYKEFLSERTRIKNIIDEECEKAGIA